MSKTRMTTRSVMIWKGINDVYEDYKAIIALVIYYYCPPILKHHVGL
jgi:hypothetical protein